MHNAQHIPTFIQALSPTINKYGYFGVGGLLFLEDFGIIVPGETVLIAAAFYAGFGKLNILLVILIGVIAAVLGDNFGFAIGNYGGRPLIEKVGKFVRLTPERLDKAEDLFNRRGGWIVVVARFIDGLRQLNGIIAGISEMRWLKFLTFNLIGAVIWVSFWALMGYFGGSHVSTFLNYELYFTLALVVVFILRLIYKQIRKRQKQYKS